MIAKMKVQMKEKKLQIRELLMKSQLKKKGEKKEGGNANNII